MKHAVDTAVKISHNTTQIKVQQGTFVRKYFRMNIQLVKICLMENNGVRANPSTLT
jgi:hypothetical protein